MTSRAVELQIKKNDKWVTIQKVAPENNSPKTKIDLQILKNKVSQIRFYQPAHQGPANRPNIMWISEIELF